MKTLKWFLKEKGKLRLVKVSELLTYTSQDKYMKIETIYTQNEVQKIVEFVSAK
jgi:hypothetical protein